MRQNNTGFCFKLTCLATASLLAFTAPTESYAQNNASIGAMKIGNVQVRGNQRIETSTILSFFGIGKGDTVTESQINQGLQSVYDSGLFADVKISAKGSTLVVNVEENPIVSDVVFEGNKRVKDDELSAEVSLGARSVYTKASVQQDVRRILDVYRRSGRFAVSVAPKIIELDQNRVNLVYEITEGDKSSIARVSFVGNQAFNDARLQSIIATKESRWYRFFSGDDNYDPDRLEFDKELLRRFYVSKGYADFRVLAANAELTPDKEDFFVTFTIDEGQRYNYGKISIESQLKDVASSELQTLLTNKTGKTFNATEVESSIENVTNFLGDKGYAFVDVKPQYDQDKSDAIINLHYVVKEGPRVYVENININGNVRTLDQVIRREFNIAEGDPYNASQIKRSKQKIENLGFFSETNFENERGSADDKVDINVDVKEQSTGELTFGAGFSTSDGALGDISIVERNLLGKGQYLKLNFTLASTRQEIDLSFTEPYFMGKNLATGFDLFSIKRDGNSSNTNLTFDNESIGGVLRTSYAITDHLRHSLKYSLRSDDITDIDANASTFIKRQEGENTTSLVGHSLQYDQRDSRFNTTEGYFVRLNQDFAGVGGDSEFIRHEVRGGYYVPLHENRKWVLRLTGSAGHIVSWGDDDVRINHRFFIGSNEIRGFDNEGIGPRDQASNDPLGGNIYAVGSAEVGFPLGLPEELGVEGALFTDFGTLYDSDDESFTDTTTGVTSTVLDDASPRLSVGVGLSWRSPVGPIRVDLSHALLKEDYDETEVFKFSFGTRF